LIDQLWKNKLNRVGTLSTEGKVNKQSSARKILCVYAMAKKKVVKKKEVKK